MDPITGILVGASLLGGILQGTGGRKQISPDWLREHFGPQMVNAETMEYFNRILNSPYGQQQLSQAVQGGQQFQNETESRAAAAGMGPAGGANSGSSIFGEAAAGGAANAAARGVRGDIWARSFDAAQQSVAQRMGMWGSLYANQGPTTQQQIGGALGNAAGVGLTLKDMQAKTQTPTPNVASPTAQPASINMLPPPTQATQPSLAPQTMASAQMPRMMGRRLSGRIDRFTGGRSMSTIQPQLS